MARRIAKRLNAGMDRDEQLGHDSYMAMAGTIKFHLNDLSPSMARDVKSLLHERHYEATTHPEAFAAFSHLLMVKNGLR